MVLKESALKSSFFSFYLVNKTKNACLKIESRPLGLVLVAGQSNWHKLARKSVLGP